MNIVFLLYNSRLYNAVSNYNIRKKNLKFARKYTTKHISEEQKEQVCKFYEPYTKVNTTFFDFYTEKTGRFDVRYIPDDLYYMYIDRYYNHWDEAKVLDNKCFYKDYFSGVRQPDVFAYRINGFWFDGQAKRTTFKQLLQRLSSCDEVVVKKATNSTGGHGVAFAGKQSDGGIEKAFMEAVEPITGDIVVQRPVKQHEVLGSINEKSVNTIRIMSLLREEDVKICSIVLRMGVGDSRVDNVSSGGFTCGVAADGKMNDTAYTKSGEKVYVHPTSGVAFKDVTIPGVDQAIEMIKSVHPRVPHFRLVSWDIAIGEDGAPLLIEANLRYGQLEFHQLNNGPIFGDDTEQVLQEVFGSKK